MLDTRELIMTIARTTAQAHGYNGLSFRELAKAVGVKSASIHYHFPTKGNLGGALAQRYTEDGSAYLEALLAETQDPAVLLRKYTDIFRAALANDNRMCLCGIMMAEYDDLLDAVRSEVADFQSANVAWLSRVLSLADTAAAEADRRKRADAIFAAISGAQLGARGSGDIGSYDAIVASYRELGLIP